jgi:hypothetical protein
LGIPVSPKRRSSQISAEPQDNQTKVYPSPGRNEVFINLKMQLDNMQKQTPPKLMDGARS